MLSGTIVSVRTGTVCQRERPDWDHAKSRTWQTGFWKDEAAGAMRVERLGLAGDEHADTRNHGGHEMAVLMYAASHYDGWRAMPGLEAMGPGGFGENLTVEGLDESSVCIGDVFEVEDVRLQVSSPRGPCAHISRRWDAEWLLKKVTETRRTGWYLRVQRKGVIERGAHVTLIERMHEGWTVDRLLRLRYESPRPAADLEYLSECAELNEDWRAKFSRLATAL